MAKIESAWMDYAICDKDGKGACLSIYLKNGNSMLMNFDPVMDAQFLNYINDEKCDPQPKTDGERIYWDNGKSLTYDELLKLLSSDNGRVSG